MLHIGSFHALSSSPEWRALQSSLGSTQSVRLHCGKGDEDRRAPARSSMQRKARMLHIGSFHALCSHEWLASHSSLGSTQSVRLNCGKGNC